MALDINLTLSDDDLGHFTQAMHDAQTAAKDREGSEIIAAARQLLDDTRSTDVPAFIRERLDSVESMIGMATDTGFGLPPEDCARVLTVLAYFADPVDFIPDTVPALGFLDDAIMIELCVRELKHELDAYDDFCDFRNSEAGRLGVDPASHEVQRAQWLEGRREELQDRMRRRRRDSYSGSGGSWKPALFKFG